jgi:histone H3/H4
VLHQLIHTNSTVYVPSIPTDRPQDDGHLSPRRYQPAIERLWLDKCGSLTLTLTAITLIMDANAAQNDEEVGLPKATVSRLIAESLPAEATCSKEARDIMVDCAVQFIHLLASEANQASEDSTRQSINADHLMKAIRSLGFEKFVEPLQQAHEDQKREQRTYTHQRKSTNKLSQSGLSEEELFKQQEELFRQARLRFEASQQLQQQQPDDREEDVDQSLDSLEEDD